MKNLNAILTFSLFSLLIACATSPSGRKQLKLMPEGQMSEMGQQSFLQMKKELPVVKSGDGVKWVNCITDEILKAMGENPSEWEVQVFKEKSPNAFALPGKKMGVHTGMMDLAGDSSELAAVIGHEIAHVKADHGNERVSQNLVVQGGLAVGSVFLGQDSKSDQLILAGLGLGAQVGVLMPFSRAHEKEADLLGLKYLAKAGFDPNGAVRLWEKMAKQGGAPPEFLSTHPNSSERAKYLQKEIKKMNWEHTNRKCNKP